MKTIEISEVEKILDAAPLSMNVLLIGDTGMGKTQTIKKYCADRGLYLKTIILSQIEASESLGIPIHTTKEFNGKTYNTIETALPTWVFELSQHKNAVLYLDEFLCSEPAVMNAFLNFLSEKEVGGIDLSHVKVIAATNIGNYTFEPDNNILSRFCMFYVENKTFGQYLKQKYKQNNIFNEYKDESDKTSNIFQPRSLKPRCHEQLLQVKNPELVAMFFEGFTNTQMTIRFNQLDDICNIVAGFAKLKEGYTSQYEINDDDLNNIAGLIYKRYPNLKNYTRVCTFANTDYKKDKLIQLCTDLHNNFRK